MWRVIWTPVDGIWPAHEDWDSEYGAQVHAGYLAKNGITDATIHQIGDQA